MVGWTKTRTLVMTVIGLVGALTIDNQLAVIKNGHGENTADDTFRTQTIDCFERLAIGQRLSPRDVYATIELKTVPECQRECTKDGDKCRSFSFGIGVKGNATCELSSKVVKETVDLKPIGTLSEPDYDLYIKKLGCKLVIEQKPSSEIPIHPGIQSNEPDGYNNEPTQSSHDSYTQIRPSDNYGSSSNEYRPNKPDHIPEVLYKPEGLYNRPRPDENLNGQHVQTTLISIRPDPHRPSHTGLGPALGYFESDKPGRLHRPERPIGYEFDGKPVRPYRPNSYDRPYRPIPYRPEEYERPFGPGLYETDRYDNLAPYRPYGRPYFNYYDDSRPPFRPSSLNHPYGKPYFRPGPGEYDPGPLKPGRPEHDDVGYSNELPKPKPGQSNGGYDSPNLERPNQDPLHFNYDRPDHDRYRPEYNRPKPETDRYDFGGRPYDRPGSSYGDSGIRPYHDGNDRPRPDYDPNRPSYDQPRPGGYQDRPSYDDSIRPSYDRPRPDGPRPSYDDSKPSLNRPNDQDRPGSEYGRPNLERPRPDYDRPLPDRFKGDYGRPGSDYDRPRPDYDRPLSNRPKGDYDRPSADYDRPRPDYDRPRPLIEESNGYLPRPDYDRPKPDFDRPRPEYDRPRPGYDASKPDFDKPRPDYDRPRPLTDESNGYLPRPDYDRPRPSISESNGYDRPNYNRPKPISDGYNDGSSNRPGQSYDRPKPFPERPSGYKGEESINRPNTYGSDTGVDPNNPNSGYSGGAKPLSDGYTSNRRGDNLEDLKNKGHNGSDVNKLNGSNKPDDPHEKSKPIISHSVGPHGETITSIITEIKPSCFRRALAGKRVTRSLVRRSLPCERVEDCQIECAEEKRFGCEGFNYRLDPTGRGNGDCELLDLPMVRLDMIRDIYTDPDYDVYEKDRNASPSCRGFRPPGVSLYGGDRFRDRDFIRGGYDRYDSDPRYGQLLPPYRDRDRDRDRRPPYFDDRRIADRRGDGHYYPDYHSGGDKYLPKPRYPPQPYLPKRPQHYPPNDRYSYDRERDRNHWGFHKGSGWGSYGGSYGNFGRPDSYYGGNANRYDGNRRNSYLPNRIGGSPDWGRYGGSYGNGGYSGGGHSGYGTHGIPSPYDVPAGDTYAPINKGTSYLPKFDPAHGNHGYGVSKPNYGLTGPGYGASGPGYGILGPSTTGYNDGFKPSYGVVGIPKPDFGYDYPKPDYGTSLGTTGYNYPKPTVQPFHHAPSLPPVSLDPVEHKKYTPQTDHVGYDFLKDECSLRTATGFRLHKVIVTKYYSVPDIYECEMLCFKEKDFECLSYSYRYTLTSSLPTDNCYLSSKNYKQLDFYTDLEPDRDFDIYTMNNRKKCQTSILKEHEYSDCFWHTRSGQRLEPKIVRASTTVNTVVECQLECLKAVKFLCRGFSFRFGSPTIGGPSENCLLTDWPFSELDNRSQFAPESGFEIYERGSFGHGCEPNHFSIRGKDPPILGSNTDQLCYVGYGAPARLLPQAIRKSLFVNSELDCKAECTKTRQQTLFLCMSFSYRHKAQRGETNCDLSEILQRDLLNEVDYMNDPDSWLFAWDNYNPDCTSLADSNQISDQAPPGRDGSFEIGHYGGYDPGMVLDTWRVYSVSGWPCKRGTKCRENRIAGFWYCELEGGKSDTWDYCCRPDHQCGYSAGYSYQWCHVGPRRSQWRKCSDRYYPYIFNLIDRHDHNPDYRPRPHDPNFKPGYGGDSPPFIIGRPGGGDSFVPASHAAPRPVFRPDRPPPAALSPHRKPSLNEYEHQFSVHFLDPPKPGGFGQPRYWPVSYLHKEMPPDETNSTDPKSDRMKMAKEVDSKYAAIQNLIEIIRSNDINNIQYEIENKTSKMDDILLVKIPLPTNFSEDTETTEESTTIVIDDKLSKPIDLPSSTKIPTTTVKVKESSNRVSKSVDNFEIVGDVNARQAPVYRRSYITRTNVTNRGWHSI